MRVSTAQLGNQNPRSMKTVSSSANTSIDGLYRIATVSHLTGIPVQTIRVWESRHAVVQPTRSAGNVRLYRRADIERLSLVKAAVDAGQAISTVAALTDRQIKARFKDTPVSATAAAAKARKAGCRVVVVGSALASVLKAAWKARSDVRVQATLPALVDTEPGLLPTVDAVIVDAPVLRNDLPVALRQMRMATRAHVVIVVYGFGSRQLLSRLDNANVIALAAPADPAQIARICQLGLAIDPTPPAALSQRLMHLAAARRYDEAFLQQLSQMPSKVQCECPNHLADLLNKLNAFERYSLECESTNIKDAAMHAMMYSASGHCREFLEEVLRRLMAHEGIAEPKA
jgi:MerR family transcriptional regulator, light-induced transcriptional regulator